MDPRYFIEKILPLKQWDPNGNPIYDFGVYDSHAKPAQLVAGPCNEEDAKRLCAKMNEEWKNDGGGRSPPRP